MEKFGERKDQISHCLERPDTYIGDKTIKTSTRLVSLDLESIDTAVFPISDGIEKIVHEVISNAVDNVPRSKEMGISMSFIKITFTEEGEISVENDGSWIPVEKRKYPYEDYITGEKKEDELYPSELFFGYFLSGTNYDDAEKRRTSGRNGLGAKLTNIFSKKFEVYNYDPRRKMKFIQKFSNNMRERSVPEVKKVRELKPPSDLGTVARTKISFVPDYEYFGTKSPVELVPILRKMAIDAALNSGLSVFFNEKEIVVPSFGNYICRLEFYKEAEKILVEAEESSLIFGTGSEIYKIGFVNGIETREGGVHFEAWRMKIIPQIVKEMNELKEVKKAEVKVTAVHVKDEFFFAVSCQVDNPTFRSQTKDFLTSPVPASRELSERELHVVMNWESTKKIWQDLIFRKAMVKPATTKEERKELSGKLVDANKAGTKFGRSCTLFLTEGDSASTFAIEGVKECGGLELNGVLPLKGKPLNSWKATPKAIFKNKEISSILATLNINPALDYELEENYKKLRYGKIIILTDQDDDGAHIQILLLGLFSRLAPALLKHLRIMSTPLVRVTERGKVIQDAYYLSEPLLAGTAKYYKGLGTWKKGESLKIFKTPKMIEFDEEENTARKDIFDKVLGEKFSSERKKLILDFDPNLLFPVDGTASFDLFVRTKLSQFYRTSIERSIPDLIDGFKEAQRKVFYGMKKGKIYSDTKVVVAAGRIMDFSGYHHGDQSLYGTMIGMAQDFTGSNNVNLLVPEGNFGTRIQGGEDAASPRYIFTKLSPIAAKFFREEDEDLLTIKVDSGETIEPERYFPIVPMILVNGTRGIGTGWRSTIPSFSLKSIIAYLKVKILGGEEPRLIPFYKGHKGISRIIYSKGAKMRLETEGIMREVGDEIEISELPVDIAFKDFKQKFDEAFLIDKKRVSNVKTEMTPDSYFLKFKPLDDQVKEELKKMLIKSEFQQPVLLKNGIPTVYSTPEEIADDFFEIRKEGYLKRYKIQTRKYMEKLKVLENKMKFIVLSLEKKIDLHSKIGTIVAELEKLEFSKVRGKFDYLVNIPVRQLTEEERDRLKTEIEQMNKKIEEHLSSSPFDFWVRELDELEKLC